MTQLTIQDTQYIASVLNQIPITGLNEQAYNLRVVQTLESIAQEVDAPIPSPEPEVEEEVDTDREPIVDIDE